MGIRFRCPNGHKLHVKAFLAGKRGICPHCGEKFQIPLESDPELDKSSKQPAASANSTSEAADISSAPQAATQVAAEKPATAALDVDVAKSDNTELPEVRVNVPDRPSIDVSDQTVASVSDQASAAAAGEPAEVAPVIQPQPTSPAAEAPTQGADPIDEAPHAVWYVRPPSGGQFGPASGDVMRSWLTEGRVTADSLVWREGWPEWKQAGSLFSGVSTTNSIPSVAAVPQILTNVPEGSSAELYRRRKSNKSTLMVVFMLLVACLILFGALVYVVRFMN